MSFDIVVDSLHGTVCRFVARPELLVHDLKLAIQSSSGIELVEQRLVAGVTELLNYQSLGVLARDGVLRLCPAEDETVVHVSLLRYKPLYLQLEGPPQGLPPGWHHIRFSDATLASGMRLKRSSIIFDEPGVYHVTCSYRLSTQGCIDRWTTICLESECGGILCGRSVAYGNLHHFDTHINTVSFLAEVTNTQVAYELKIGRDGASIMINLDYQPLWRAPSVVATLFRVPSTCAQLEGNPQELLAGRHAISFTQACMANGISVKKSVLTFDQAGVYHITVSYRLSTHGCVDRWTSILLESKSDKSVCGRSVAYGNLNGFDTHINTVSFLVEIKDAHVAHEIKMDREGEPLRINMDFIPWERSPSVIASVFRVEHSCAQLEGQNQTLPVGSSTIRFSSIRAANGIYLDNSLVNFDRSGVYQATLSYRLGGRGCRDRWTNVRLESEAGDSICGRSVAYGNLEEYDPHINNVNFLVQIEDTRVAYKFVMSRDLEPLPINEDVQPGEGLSSIVACIVFVG